MNLKKSMLMKPLLNRTEVDELVQRYLEGETTLEEEKLLRVWFSASEVPPDLIHVRTMLGFFAAERQNGYPEQVQLPSMESHIAQHKQGRPRRLIYLWTSVAAVVLMAAIGLNYMRYQRIEAEKEALLAKQNEMSLKAFGEMADAIMLVSRTLNKGLSPVSQVTESVDVTNEGNALGAIGQALSALNKVTAMLMPEQVPESAVQDEKDTEI